MHLVRQDRQKNQNVRFQHVLHVQRSLLELKCSFVALTRALAAQTSADTRCASWPINESGGATRKTAQLILGSMEDDKPTVGERDRNTTSAGTDGTRGVQNLRKIEKCGAWSSGLLQYRAGLRNRG